MKRLLAFVLASAVAACGSSPSNTAAQRVPKVSARVLASAGTASVNLSSSPSPSGHGQMVTFTATVSAADGSGNLPSGTVHFQDADPFAADLGSAPLQPGTALIDQGDIGTQNSAGGPGQGYVVGQDWTPGIPGKLVGIQVGLRNCGNATGGATLNLYTGHIFDGSRAAQPIATATAAVPGSESCSAMDGNPQGNGYFAFQEPLDVIAGEVLNFEVLYAGASYLNTFIDYAGTNPGGQGYVDYGDGLSPVGVLAFRTLMAGDQIATISTSALEAGTHNVTATYSGDGNFSSNAGSVSHEVDSTATNTTLVASANPTVALQPVTLTVNVAALSGAGTPTGQVTLYDGENNLGSLTLDGGAAIFTLSFDAGTHPLTVSYTSANAFSPSVSTELDLAALLPSITAVTAINPNPANLTDTVTVSAQVLPGVKNTGVMPSGTITFTDTYYFLDYYGNYYSYQFAAGTSGIDENGNAQSQFTAQYSGSHFITASYNGDGYYAASSDQSNYAVRQVPTQLTMTLDTVTPRYGVPFSFNVKVTTNDPTAPVPQGTVYFYDFPPFGEYSLQTAAPDSNGAVSFSTANDPANGINHWVGGSHFIEAYFVDDISGTFAFTSLDQDLTVNPSPLDQGSVTSAPTVTYGQDGTINSFVGRCLDSSDCGLTQVPYGVVDFLDGDQVFASVDLPSNGQNSVPSSLLSSSGPHSIRVHYRGNPDYAAVDSPAVQVTVLKAQTATQLQVSQQVVTYGHPLYLTATVAQTTPGLGQPSGSVTFYDAGVAIGGSAVQDGMVTLSPGRLTVGSHAFTASYDGDTNFSGSVAAPLGAQVVAASTTTTLSAANTELGETAFFTATVATQGESSVTPAGVVLFTLDGSSGVPMTVTSGTATWSTSSLTGGAHFVTATYLGTAQFKGSVSDRVTQTVSPATPSVALSAAPTAAVAGQQVVLTASVSSPAGTPAGSVTFNDGASSLGNAALDASGRVSLTVSSLATGQHFLTAAYSGNASFNPATGNAAISINQATVAMKLSSASNPSAAGQAVAISAHLAAVAPGTGVPTGSVAFNEGPRSLGSISLDASGNAAVSYTPGLGSHQITASYSGDSRFSGVSGNLLQTANPAATVVALGSAASPTVKGESVSLVATVQTIVPGLPTPSGLVSFLDSGVTLGTGKLDEMGIAAFTTTALAAGSHQLYALYLGTPSFSSSTSSPLEQNVTQAATTLSLNSSAAASVFGQSLTLTANVSVTSPGSGTPAGSVHFNDGDTDLGSIALDASGAATLKTSALAVGLHALSATYAGDANFTAPSDASFTQQVDAASTRVALASSSNPSLVGQPLTFTVTVSAAAPGAGVPTSGTVTFSEGDTELGMVAIDANGSAAFAAAVLAVGNHTISASYNGNDSFASSTSKAVTQWVNQSGVSVSLNASQTFATYGSQLNFTATVSAASGVPTGSVVLMDGVNPLGVFALNGGAASFSTSALTFGNHSLTATYSGDINFTSGAQGNLNETIAPAATNATLTSAPTLTTFGQGATLKATLTAAVSGISGLVAFKNNDTLLGTAPVASDGTATLLVSSLPVGTQPLTALYAGDGNFAPTNAFSVATIDKASSSVGLLSSAAPAVSGQAITFTAQVSSSVGIPTGTVVFFEGKKQLGMGKIDRSGQAVFATASLLVGTHGITAAYGGDGSYLTSRSAFNQEVQTDAVEISLASSQNPSIFGSAVTFTVQVAANAPGSGTPSGSIAFFDGEQSLGAANLVAGAASLTTSALSAVPHVITAQYSGDDSFAAGSSTLPQAIALAPSTAALAASVDAAVAGQPVSLTATVTSKNGKPSGSVTFIDGLTTLGSATLGTDGTASMSIAAVGIGPHAFTASYASDGSFAPSSSDALNLPVAQASTQVALISSASPAEMGQALTLTTTVSAVAPGTGTPSGTVTFSEGSTALGSGTLDVHGNATVTLGNLGDGTHAIVASYGGDVSFVGDASTPLTQLVVKDGVTVSLSSSASSAAFAAPVVITAKVAAGAGRIVPAGSVSLTDGTVALGTLQLDAAGTATLTLPAFESGSHTVSATYSGDTAHQGGAFAAMVQDITKAVTANALSSDLTTTQSGHSFTLKATVTTTATARTPTGTVSFRSSGVILQTSPLGADGTVSYTTSANLPAGKFQLDAVYSGDTDYAASTSTALATSVTSTGCSSTSDTTGGLLLLLGVFGLAMKRKSQLLPVRA